MSESYTKPFKGILFSGEKVNDMASCVCPPYDVITDPDIYYERHPYNAIRLELPRPLGDMDEYRTAQRTMEDWLKSGVLVYDRKETVYVYEQEFQVEGTSCLRRGFIALHKLEKRRILTHEQTRKRAKEDRERLISTLGAFTSLIFGLYEDREERIEHILASSQKEEIFDFVDEQFVRNRFYRMTQAADIDRLSDLMSEKKIYIADGHHRLDVSYRLNLPYVPLYLTNMYSGGIVIFPYHRIVDFETPSSLVHLLDSIADHLAVLKYPLTGKTSVESALQRIAASPEPEYIMYSKDDPTTFYILTDRRTTRFADETIHETLKQLKVNILHTAILKDLLHIKEEEISFTQDTYESIRRIREGTIDLALFLPPTTVQEVKEVADHGLYMPPKSTFFHPKVLTGIVFCNYA
jgi:uncharacterized protein (DUF1015 family)